MFRPRGRHRLQPTHLWPRTIRTLLAVTLGCAGLVGVPTAAHAGAQACNGDVMTNCVDPLEQTVLNEIGNIGTSCGGQSCETVVLNTVVSALNTAETALNQCLAAGGACSTAISLAEQEAQAAEQAVLNCALSSTGLCAQVKNLVLQEAGFVVAQVPGAVSTAESEAATLLTVTESVAFEVEGIILSCASGSNSTCATVVNTGNNAAALVEGIAVSCANGSNSTCSNAESTVLGLAFGAVGLVESCASGGNSTCNTAVSTVNGAVQLIETCAGDAIAGLGVLEEFPVGDSLGCYNDGVLARGLLVSVANIAVGCESGATSAAQGGWQPASDSLNCYGAVQTAKSEVNAVAATAQACAGGQNQICNTVIAAIVAAASAAEGCEFEAAQALGVPGPRPAAGSDTLNCGSNAAFAKAEADAVVATAQTCANGQNNTCNTVIGAVHTLLGCAEGALQALGAPREFSDPDSLGCSGDAAEAASLVSTVAATTEDVATIVVDTAQGCANGSNANCNQVVALIQSLANQIASTAQACASGGGTCGTAVVLAEGVVATVAGAVTSCSNGATSACASAAVAVQKSPCLNGAVDACSQPPTAAVLPDVDPETVFPANQLTGTIDTGAGVGVPALEVDFFVDPAGSSLDDVPADQLGSTTTDSSGTYVFTLPATLDAFATSQANANGGHLPVMITASANINVPGTGNTTFAIAEGVTSIQVGGGADYFDSLPPTLTLYPATSVDLESAPDPGVDVTDPSVPASTHYQGTIGSGGTVTTVNGVPSTFNPFLVNGVDYRNAVPVQVPIAAAAPAAGSTGSPCPGGRELFVNGHHLKPDKPGYVIVGEMHAWADQYASFVYGKTSDTTTSVGISGDAKHFTIEGSDNIHDSNSGFDWHKTHAGPYYGKQMRMQFMFQEWKDQMTCEYDRSKTFYKYQVVPAHNTWEGEEGANVQQYDGYQPYQNSNPNYRYVLRGGDGAGISITSGHGYGYGGAFSVFYFSGGAQTMHTQYITVTADRGAEDYEHDVWGNNKYPPNGPQLMYSY